MAAIIKRIDSRKKEKKKRLDGIGLLQPPNYSPERNEAVQCEDGESTCQEHGGGGALLESEGGNTTMKERQKRGEREGRRVMENTFCKERQRKQCCKNDNKEEKETLWCRNSLECEVECAVHPPDAAPSAHMRQVWLRFGGEAAAGATGPRLRAFLQMLQIYCHSLLRNRRGRPTCESKPDTVQLFRHHAARRAGRTDIENNPVLGGQGCGRQPISTHTSISYV